MLKFVALVFSFGAVVAPAFGAMNTGRGARSNAARMMPAPRATASVSQLGGVSTSAAVTTTTGTVTTTNGNTTTGTTAAVDTTSAPVVDAAPAVDMRTVERDACMANNIGIGNTFVWASRFSDPANYATLVEDVESPTNNTCFVKVEIKSDDPNVRVDDIPTRYFEMGRAITCGSWADEGTIKKRILDAKKSARTWATVGGVVGGAGIGVGAMELFGNKLIGGSVQGQKALTGAELKISQLKVLEKDNPTEFANAKAALLEIRNACTNKIWSEPGSGTKPSDCSVYEKVWQEFLGSDGKDA